MGMGSISSRARGPAPVLLITERDAEAQCDSGDVLLMREGVLHAALRVAIDKHVARDISRMQQGAFPMTRLTRLPLWTSCALIVRVEGRLHVLDVDMDGIRLVPFTNRVAQRSARHDTYAIRRLQHVRNEGTVAFFQELVAEISRSTPLQWPLTQSQQPVAASESQCSTPPPFTEWIHQLRATLVTSSCFLSVVQRALELFHRTKPISIPSELPPVLHSELEASSRLATAVVVAVYSLLGIVSSDLAASFDLTPSSLCSTSELPPTRLPFTPSNALGLEMKLV